MTRTTRRETNRLRAEIMEGLAEYQEDRARVARIGRCGTMTEDVPQRWLRLIAKPPPATADFPRIMRRTMFGRHRPPPFFLN